MQTLKQWEHLKTNQHSIDIRCENSHILSIYVLENNLFRVWLKRNNQPTLSKSWMITSNQTNINEKNNQPHTFDGRNRESTEGFSCPHFACQLLEDCLVIATDELRLTIKKPLALVWEQKIAGDWQIIAKDRPTGAYMLGRSRRDVAHFMEKSNHDFYTGLGEKTGTVNRTNQRYEMRNLDALGYDAQSGDPLYKHWPFYQVRTANKATYGIFYDNLSHCWFDFGNEKDNYHGCFSSYRAEDGDIDYYFLSSESTKQVTQHFLNLTGKHPFLPKWSLGYSGSTMHYTDAPDAQHQLLTFIELCQKHQIPCDSFQLSSGYTSIGDKRYVFHWNHDKVPEPQQLSDAFHAAGLKLAANIKPCLLIDHPLYDSVREAGLFIRDSQSEEPELSTFWDAMGSHLDFTNPATIKWWQDKVAEKLLDYGIDSTWNDNNEYEIWDDEAKCHGFGQPLPIRNIRPLMPLLMMRASFEAQQQYDKNNRPYLISRSGCPGMQRYAQTWTGDNFTSWKTLKWNIRMGVGMSLSGLYFVGHDVGGFAGGKPDAELFVRWIQSALLLPRFTIHSWNDDNTVNEPWMHPEVIDTVRDNLSLRYRLIPYLYTLLWKAATEDEPFIRPTFLDHEQDELCYLDTDDYLIGEQLLVTPVVLPEQKTRSVYLPNHSDGWYDFYHKIFYAGGQKIIIDTPLDILPLWVKAGSIIPESQLLHADTPEKDTARILNVFPQATGQSSGEIFDDDGKTYQYQQGKYYLLHYQMSCNSEVIAITLTRTGNYQPAYSANIRFEFPSNEKRKILINEQPFSASQSYTF